MAGLYVMAGPLRLGRVKPQSPQPRIDNPEPAGLGDHNGIAQDQFSSSADTQ